MISIEGNKIGRSTVGPGVEIKVAQFFPTLGHKVTTAVFTYKRDVFQGNSRSLPIHMLMLNLYA